MHSIKPEQSFPFDNNTLVVLTAKCPEGEAIIKQSGSHWIAKPLPRQLQDETLNDVFRGWLYLRSMLTQHRFVHVINDRLFDVAFETKDSVIAKRPITPQPSQAKGNANV
mgnify:FL=1